MRRRRRSGRRSKRNGAVSVEGSFSLAPWIAWNTRAQSSIVRHSGPTLSMLQESTMPPYRLTRPNVGRSALTPQRRAGDTIEPCVSVPIANATQPAAVADAGPADEPLDPCAGFHGFFV